MFKVSFVFVLLVMLVLTFSLPTLADAPSPAQARLEQEPYLYCVAFEVGLPAETVALAKIKFDTKWGAAHNVSSLYQWADSWENRAQYFTDWLGVPNPLYHKWCERLLGAQKRLLE